MLEDLLFICVQRYEDLEIEELARAKRTYITYYHLRGLAVFCFVLFMKVKATKYILRIRKTNLKQFYTPK